MLQYDTCFWGLSSVSMNLFSVCFGIFLGYLTLTFLTCYLVPGRKRKEVLLSCRRRSVALQIRKRFYVDCHEMENNVILLPMETYIFVTLGPTPMFCTVCSSSNKQHQSCFFFFNTLSLPNMISESVTLASHKPNKSLVIMQAATKACCSAVPLSFALWLNCFDQNIMWGPPFEAQHRKTVYNTALASFWLYLPCLLKEAVEERPDCITRPLLST